MFATTLNINDTHALKLLHNCPHAPCKQDLSEQQLQAIFAFKETLIRSARRPISITPVHLSSISCFERCVLMVLAASQLQDNNLITKSLEWLVPYWSVKQLIPLANKVAMILEEQGIQLSIPKFERPVRREQAGLYAAIG